MKTIKDKLESLSNIYNSNNNKEKNNVISTNEEKNEENNENDLLNKKEDDLIKLFDEVEMDIKNIGN